MSDRLAFHAEQFGLLLVDPDGFTLERRRHGKGWRLCFSGGEAAPDKALKARVKALVLPPAWANVRVCVEENGHIQAIGRDEKGRLQYRYHDGWVAVRNAVKTERLLRFGRALPRLRRRITADMRRRAFDRTLASATAARLVDVAAMRPGHEKYAADGGRGVASLRPANLKVGDRRAVLDYVGKSRKNHHVEIEDRGLVKALKRAKDGAQRGAKRLFRFRPETGGRPRELTATLLNGYMREASGARVSAKDFRTFHGSAEALRFLLEEPEATRADTESKRRRAVAGAMRSVSEVLRNTPAVARASYVHPGIVAAFEAGTLDPGLLKGRPRDGLTRVETGLLRFLEAQGG